jgi:hypothetical protein
VNVRHLLAQKLRREHILRVVALFPHFAALAALETQALQGCPVALSAIVPQKPIGYVKIPDGITERVRVAALNDEVHVVRHDDKGIEFETLSEPHTVQGVDDQPFDDVTIEEMVLSKATGRHEIEVSWIERGMPTGHRVLLCGRMSVESCAEWVTAMELIV